jgi:signal transduction histidine kinase
MLVAKINRMQRSLDMKDTYNASMIHELRNPLNAVIGSIGLLKMSKNLIKEDQDTLNLAAMSGEILITMINNALDGAKLEANRLELDAHMTDIVETLQKAVSIFSWKAKEKNVNIILKVGHQIPEQIEIDDARLTQILVNIIGNAVKFTPHDGQVKVHANFIPDDNS